MFVTVSVPSDVRPPIVVEGKPDDARVNVGFTPLPVRLVCPPTVTVAPWALRNVTLTTSVALCVTAAAGEYERLISQLEPAGIGVGQLLPVTA